MRYRITKEIWLFGIGGILYGLIELCWRGRTHWSMIIVGGICFRLIGYIHERYRAIYSTITRCALCAGVISLVELIAGLIVNKWFQLDVWDYSRIPFNILGQICPVFSVCWGALSLLAKPVFDRCNAQIKPHHNRCSQHDANGHSSHFGERAVQVSLPNNTSR